MAGAAGYLLKQVAGVDLVGAVRTVAAGGSLLDSKATAVVLARLRKGDEPADPRYASLSPQERRILGLIADGLTNRPIPISCPPASTTGSAVKPRPVSTAAAARTGVPGPTVTTGRVMTSCTSIGISSPQQYVPYTVRRGGRLISRRTSCSAPPMGRRTAGASVSPDPPGTGRTAPVPDDVGPASGPPAARRPPRSYRHRPADHQEDDVDAKRCTVIVDLDSQNGAVRAVARLHTRDGDRLVGVGTARLGPSNAPFRPSATRWSSRVRCSRWAGACSMPHRPVRPAAEPEARA
jgi:hypothetical protein